MTFFTFIDRVIIPSVIAIMLVGGVSGLTLGCALVINHSATLRFISRMNRWVSTREALAPLDARIDVEPAGARSSVRCSWSAASLPWPSFSCASTSGRDLTRRGST